MVQLGITEHTQRQGFISALESVLPVEKFRVFNDVSVKFTDEAGSRVHYPDVVVVEAKSVQLDGESIRVPRSAIICVMETKRSSRSINDGLAQLFEYMESAESNWGFCTNFRNCLAVDASTAIPKLRPFEAQADDFAVAIVEVANFVYRALRKEEKLFSPEENERTVVSILDTVVDELSHLTSQVDSNVLEQSAGLFMAKKIDSDYLDEVGIEGFERDVEKAAAYLIVNQIMFYSILSKEVTKYKPLVAVASLDELQSMFDTVLDDDFTPVFGRKFLRDFPSSALGPVNNLIRNIRKLNLDSIHHDIIGKIFHNILPIAIRKRIAAYYTGNPAASLLAKLCVYSADDKVADISCGSGTFLVQAYRAKKAMSQLTGLKNHSQLIGEIYGVDISVFAAHLASINLALQEPKIYTDEVNIMLSDALMLAPGGLVSLDTWTTKQVATQDGREERELAIPVVDAVLINPPFTQTRRMEHEYRDFLKKVISSKHWEPYLCQSKYVMGKKKVGTTKKPVKKIEYNFGWLNLHTIFLVHAFDFLKKGGRLGAVIPAQTLSADYSIPLKQFFKEKTAIDAVISSEAQLTFSEDCEWKEILLVAHKRRSNEKQETVKFVTLKEELTIDNSAEIAEGIRTGESGRLIRMTEVAPSRLWTRSNWNYFFHPHDLIELIEEVETLEGVCTGHSLFEKGGMIRGIEPRGKDFFFLPNKFWSIEKDNRTKIVLVLAGTGLKTRLSIDKKFLTPTVRFPSDVSSISQKSNSYLLSVRETSRLTPDLLKYTEVTKTFLSKQDRVEISAIAAKGEDWLGHLARQIREKGKPGHIALLKKFMPTSRALISFYVEDDETYLPNTFYMAGVGDRLKDKALVAYLNSTFFLIQVLASRNVLGSASEELPEERYLELYYLDVFEMSSADVKRLAEIVDEYHDAALPYVMNQKDGDFRKRLDVEVGKVLGLENAEEFAKRIEAEYFRRCEELYPDRNSGSRVNLNDFAK